MKKVLIIAYYWPPTGGSGVQRWLKFSKYLVRKGYDVTVYTPSNPSDVLIDESLLKDVDPRITVLKQPIFEPNSLYKKFLGRKGGQGNSKVTYIHDGPKSFKEKVGLYVRANFFIPDPKISWKRKSVKFLKEYIDGGHSQDVIITTGPPQSMHLIGRALSKDLGIKWIADFRDPWTGMYNFRFLPLTRWALKRHQALEQAVFEEADEIIQAAPAYAADIVAAVPSRSEHVHCISNGYDEDDYPSVRPALDEQFTITVTGMLRVDDNYEDFLLGVRELALRNAEFGARYLLKVVGRVDETISARIAELGLRYEYCGYRPHSEAVSAQLSAHVLFLPTYKSDEMGLNYPGRLFEYLASGRPIVSVVKDDSDVARLIRLTDSGVCIPAGVEAPGLVASALEDIFTGSRTFAHKNIQDYSRAALTDKLIELF